MLLCLKRLMRVDFQAQVALPAKKSKALWRHLENFKRASEPSTQGGPSPAQNWFVQLGNKYQTGYLLHGPPGAGKVRPRPSAISSVRLS